MNTTSAQGQPQPVQRIRQKDCLSCRVIGSGAFGAVGIYALRQSRAQAPGSIIGKRITAGVGVCFLVGSVLRWSW